MVGGGGVVVAKEAFRPSAPVEPVVAHGSRPTRTRRWMERDTKKQKAPSVCMLGINPVRRHAFTWLVREYILSSNLIQ